MLVMLSRESNTQQELWATGFQLPWVAHWDYVPEEFMMPLFFHWLGTVKFRKDPFGKL